VRARFEAIGQLGGRGTCPKKENPAVGAPGYVFIVIGVYGFNYAAWLRAVSHLSSLLFARFSQCVVVFAALTSSSCSIFFF